MSEPFLGQISMVGFNFAPRGWALCDGQILPINQNQALFSLLGDTYGGDGRTSFALPDLRGRAAVHPGGGPGLDNITWGQRGGAEAVALAASEMPVHRHDLLASTDLANANVPGNALPAARGRGGLLLYAAPGSEVAMNPDTVTVAGANAPHDNMQPYLVLNFVIALQGIFPSRS